MTTESHVCENTKLLTDIQIQLATNGEEMKHLVECLEEWRSAQDEHNRDIKAIVTRHELEITDLKHNCRFPEYWESAWKRLKTLEDDYQRRQGAGKWEERIYKYIEYAICVVLGAAIMWWIGGGHIS